MDKILKQKRGLKRRHTPYVIIGGILIIALCWMIFGSNSSSMKVNRDRVVIADVERAQFNDYVRISGQVLPINSIQLSAVEGGMVAERLVEEGSMVHKGEVIIKMTNTMLNLNILDSEAQLAEKQNLLRNTQIILEQEKLTLRKDKLQLDMDVARKSRKFEQYGQLYTEKLASKEEYLQAKEDYEFSLGSHNLNIERQHQDSMYRSVQMGQMEESLQSIRRNLMLVRQRIDDLNVKAPVEGQLGLLNVEIGQSVVAGSRIGQINVLSDFKVEASIDEHYIDRIQPNLTATFERQDKNFALRVRRVFPEVRDKQFKAEFVFDGERPDNIRAGQTYYINLELGEPIEAVIIPRGTFFHVTGGKWIFVLSVDGSKAVRRPITIARQNPLFYEVTSGLEAGERVITSGYENYKETQNLILK